MQNTYWFRRKKYGYGLRPAGWRGWLVTVVFIALITANAYRLDVHSHSVSDTVRPFVIETLAMIVVFGLIAYWKGERPWRWQWGKKNSSTTP